VIVSARCDVDRRQAAARYCVAWIGAVNPSLLPLHGCKSGKALRFAARRLDLVPSGRAPTRLREACSVPSVAIASLPRQLPAAMM
jgi:hypothetical protein